MNDMSPTDIVGDYQEHTLELYKHGTRKVYVTDIETPFPEGKLIVSVVDLDGNITHANKAFVEMSGYQENELIGELHSILRHPDMPKAAYADLWQKMAKGEKWHGDLKNLRKDGGFYWVYASIVPNVRNGEIKGYTSVRRKPSREKVEEHIELYKGMKNEEI